MKNITTIRKMATTTRSWRILISEEMDLYNDSWDGATVQSDGDLDQTFINNDPLWKHDGPEGCIFRVWTDNRIYFPVMSEISGSVHVASVSKNPNKEQIDYIF